MASEAEISELSSLFERMIRNRDMSLFLPFISGLLESSSISRNNDDPDEESESNDDSNHQRIILVNPITQGMVVIEGVSSLEDLLNQVGSNKKGQPPASKESIEAMEKVEIGEGDVGGECVVCLEEFEVGRVVKEMPCKHRFHGDCIEKWLGLHGSCPVCRYQMPVDEKGDGNKSDEEESGERRRVGGGGEVWVSFSINRRSRENQNQATSGGDSSDSSSSPRGDDDDDDDDDVEVEN